MKIITVILSLLLTQMATARIGETLEECEKRYGAGRDFPIDTSSKAVDKVRGYIKMPFMILSYFVDGRCAAIEYRSQFLSKLDTKTANEIVKRNLANTEFIHDPADSEQAVWSCKDDESNATLYVEEIDGKYWAILKILSNEAIAKNKKKKEDDLRKKVDELGL